MNKSESIAKLASALVKAQSQMGGATKDAKNPFFKSNYADLNAVREACTPALNANGITVLQPTVVLDGKNYVETVLLHESGEYISSLTEIKVAKANDAQAEGSGISYARRYGLQSIASLGSYDDDGEAAVSRGAKASSVVKSALVAQVVEASVAVESAPVKKASSFKKPTPVAAAPASTASSDIWE